MDAILDIFNSMGFVDFSIFSIFSLPWKIYVATFLIVFYFLFLCTSLFSPDGLPYNIFNTPAFQKYWIIFFTSVIILLVTLQVKWFIDEKDKTIETNHHLFEEFKTRLSNEQINLLNNACSKQSAELACSFEETMEILND